MYRGSTVEGIVQAENFTVAKKVTEKQKKFKI